MKRRDFIALGISGLALAACGRRQKLSVLPAGTTVLAFGDSVTFGTGAGTGEDWPTQLAERTAWRIINAGVPGDTAAAGVARIQALLDEYKPAMVILEIGGNDFLRRRPADAVKRDLKALIDAVRSSGAIPLLVGVPEPSVMAVVAGKPTDSPIYAALGKEEKIPLVSDVFSNVLSRPELRADAIHPNAAGYRRLADEMYSALKQLGLAP